MHQQSADRPREYPVENNGYQSVSDGGFVRGRDLETGPPSKIRFVVLFLSQAVVVSSQDVLSFQTLSRSSQWGFALGHGHWHDCGIRVPEQYHRYHFVSSRYGHQRLERFQKNCLESGHVQICFHDLRKSFDRTENPREMITARGIGWVSYQVQTLDETISDFAGPVTDRCSQKYDATFM